MPAPYKEQVTRKDPSCFIFLIDQSDSMADSAGGAPGKTKAQGVATIVNRLLQDLIRKCDKGEGKPRDYFHLSVIGYGGRVGSAFTGPLADRDLVPISEVALAPARVEERVSKEVDDIGKVVEVPAKFAVWFDPVSENGTPMCAALEKARHLAQSWVDQHPSSYPPTVINITDGESTDGDPTLTANALTNIANSHGAHVLLFNIHISSHEAPSITFPDSVTEGQIPDKYARLLFNMSSALPEPIKVAAKQEGKCTGDQPRGFAFNTDMVELMSLLDIGTQLPLR
jgi:uncharacterized protein YegL